MEKIIKQFLRVFDTEKNKSMNNIIAFDAQKKDDDKQHEPKQYNILCFWYLHIKV